MLLYGTALQIAALLRTRMHPSTQLLSLFVLLWLCCKHTADVGEVYFCHRVSSIAPYS